MPRRVRKILALARLGIIPTPPAIVVYEIETASLRRRALLRTRPGR